MLRYVAPGKKKLKTLCKVRSFIVPAPLESVIKWTVSLVAEDCARKERTVKKKKSSVAC